MPNKLSDMIKMHMIKMQIILNTIKQELKHKSMHSWWKCIKK